MNSERSFQANYSIVAIFLFCLLVIGTDRTGQFPVLRPITTTLYRWVLLLSAFGLILGVINIMWVHLRRVQLGQQEWVHSLVLLVMLVAVLVIGLIDTRGTLSPLVEWVFNNIIAPLQSALFAITAFFLAAAAYRFLRVGRNGSMWILIGALLMLLIQMPASSTLLTTTSQDAFYWVLDRPIMAALRGVILGSSLSLFVIMLRFILNRP